MNKQRWTFLFIAAVLFCLSELLPPWVYKCEPDYGVPASAGYHFLLKPPEPQAVCISSTPLPGPLPTVFKNSKRLNVQRAVLVSLTVGLMLVLGNRRNKLYVVTGFLVLFIGAVTVLLLVLMIGLGI